MVDKRWIPRCRNIAITCLAVGGLAACGSSEPTGATGGDGGETEQKGDIVLGEVIGASGWLTAFDLPPSDGAKLAIEEINAEGGVEGRKFKLIRKDHTSDPAKVNQATQEALTDGADVVLASCNYEEAGPSAQVASAKQKVTFSYCGGEPTFTRQVGDVNKLVFDMGNETNGVGATMAEFAGQQGWTRAYVLEDTAYDYTRQMAKFFRAAHKDIQGATVAGTETFKNGDASVAGQIAKIKSKASEIDVVVLASTLPGAGTALRQLRSSGLDVPILTGDGMDSRSVAKTVRNLDEFYFVSAASVYGDDPDPKVNEFFEKLKAETGEDPDGAYGVFGYSIVQALTAALRSNGGDASGPALAKALEQLKEEPVLLGPLTFSADQHVDPYRPQRILEYKDGKARYLATVQADEVPDPF